MVHEAVTAGVMRRSLGHDTKYSGARRNSTTTVDLVSYLVIYCGVYLNY